MLKTRELISKHLISQYAYMDVPHFPKQLQAQINQSCLQIKAVISGYLHMQLTLPEKNKARSYMYKKYENAEHCQVKIHMN